VLSEIPERFTRLVAMNTGIAAGRPSQAFATWRTFAQRATSLDIPKLMTRSLLKRKLSAEEAAAYAAPFPSREHQMAALVFPRLVPTRADHPGAYDNRQAIARLKELDIPVLLPWGAEDAITLQAERHLRSIFKNVAPPMILLGVGHFIQEDAGEEVAQALVEWVR
jgi:haloalkane dehalogenase